MFKLVKNELTKIFSKKSIYVILAIFIIISIAGVSLSKVLNNILDNSYIDSNLAYAKEYIKTIDKSTEDGKLTYAEESAYIKELELMKKYGENSWQSYIIQQYLHNYIYDLEYFNQNLTSYIQNVGLTQEEVKQEYDETIKKLDNGDWRSFAEEELSNINSIIESNTKDLENVTNVNTIEDIKEQNETLKISQQVLKWRLEKNIPYNDEKYGDLLSTYQNAGTIVINMNHEYGINEKNYKEKETKEYTYDLQKSYQTSLSEYNVSKYKIENEIVDNNNLESIFEGIEKLFIIIIAISIAGTIVSEEFNKGTIKMLLIRPYSRKKILTSKIIATAISIIIATIVIILADTLIYGIAYGFNTISMPVVLYNYTTNSVITMNVYQYLFVSFINIAPMLIILFMIAIMIGTVLTSSSTAIVISLLVYMMSNIIETIVMAYQKTWGKFIPTLNWDFSQYLYGTLPNLKGMTIEFSATICIVLIIAMGIITYENFERKNIKNV